MFSIGFLELLVVGIVALVVLGPERLPGAIRTASLWIGRLRRSFNSIKADIEKEIGADEIRRQLRNEEIMEKFRNTQSHVQNSISAIKKEADEFKKNVDLESQIAGGSATPTDSTTTPAVSAPDATASATPAPTAPASELPANESAVVRPDEANKP
jgi:sec-independent protein translocase protein TatB